MNRLQRKLFARFQDEANDDGSDLGGGDDSSKNNDDKVSQLEQSLAGVLDTVRVMASGQAQLQESLRLMSESMAQNNNAGNKQDEEFLVGDADLETMSRKDLIAHIQNNTVKATKDLLTPLAKQLETLGLKLDENISSTTVKDFQKDHADLMEWKTEIGSIFKAGRANNVPDAYRLAKLDDPEKAKKIDLKYDPPKSAGDSIKLGFRGFPPAGSKSGGDGKNTRMTPTQAAEAAWEEATAAFPGIDEFLNN